MTKDRMFGGLLRGVCCAFMALALVVVLKADVIDHSKGFDPHTDLTANGDASFVGAIARLTPAANDKGGSIFSNNRVCVDSFTTSFTIKIGPFDPMADGMTFVIQGNSATALGSRGGGLGYGQDRVRIPPPEGTTIPNSVAIKFDVWDNSGETDNSTGLFTNGNSPTVPTSGWVICDASGCNTRTVPDTLVVLDKRPVAMGGSGIDLHSVHEFQVDLSYNGITTTLTETITDTVTDASITVDYQIDIPDTIGDDTAFVGFTGATGGVNATHDVLTWRYECPAPILK